MIFKDGDTIKTACGKEYRVLYATKRDIDGQHISLKVRPVNNKRHKATVVEVRQITHINGVPK